MFKTKFLQNNFIFMAGTLISGLLGYAFHFIVSRQVSVAQYGELQSLLSVMLIFGVFNSTLSYFTIKHTSVFAAHNDFEASREFARHLSARVFKITLAILAVLLIASPLLARFLHFSSYSGFVIVSFAAFFSTMTVIYMEILRGWQKFFLLSLAGVATTFVKFAAGAILAFLYQTTAAISFSLLLATLAGWYLVKFWSRKTIGNVEVGRKESNWPASNASRSNTGWRQKYFSETNIRRSALHIFFFSLALILVSNFDVLLVKYFASADTAGLYGAFALLGKIVLWLNMSIAGVLLPDACADGHAGKRPGKYYLLNSYALMASIALGLMAFYYLAPNFVVNLFFGKQYLLDTQILWLFGMMSFLLSLLTLEANLSFAKRDFRVVYLLAATVILMIAGLSEYHADLGEIVLVFSASFFLGYISILILNLYIKAPRIQYATE